MPGASVFSIGGKQKFYGEDKVEQVRDHKQLGAFYTPPEVVRSLVDWATAKSRTISVLDPACGDGRFLEGLPNVTGVDVDPFAASEARKRCPQAAVLTADFFGWASSITARFDAIVGNPPFVRYQRFTGEDRNRALSYCADQGVKLSGLSSSWAPFVVGGASLLKPRGRLALVIPAEIGYANYARPVLDFLLENFGRVEIRAVQQKLFPELSEDCWLLFAEEYGSTASSLHFSTAPRFLGEKTRWTVEAISHRNIRMPGFRLRAYLLPRKIRMHYDALIRSSGVRRLGDLANLGIGYVTGSNDFFHLRPSEAKRSRIPERYLRPTVRSSRDLSVSNVTKRVVAKWLAADRPVLLLDLSDAKTPPTSVMRYLGSPAGEAARRAYKCRNRDPWYRVPDVRVPNAFLSIMSTRGPRLVGNSAGCVCTNSIHAVFLRNGVRVSHLQKAWTNPMTELSCEIEGHSLGGGMLKVEPGEARRIGIPLEANQPGVDLNLLREGVEIMRTWRRSNASRNV